MILTKDHTPSSLALASTNSLSELFQGLGGAVGSPFIRCVGRVPSLYARTNRSGRAAPCSHSLSRIISSVGISGSSLSVSFRFSGITAPVAWQNIVTLEIAYSAFVSDCCTDRLGLWICCKHILSFRADVVDRESGKISIGVRHTVGLLRNYDLPARVGRTVKRYLEKSVGELVKGKTVGIKTILTGRLDLPPRQSQRGSLRDMSRHLA